MDTQTKTQAKGQEPETRRVSGAEAVVLSLLEEGVDTMFGYVGGAIMPVYDVLYDYQDKLKHVMVRHEQGAIHAAQGFARISRKVGVCLATSGPGATNLITGLADAMLDSTPLVCITGQVTSGLLGSDAFQETDVVGISMPVTKVELPGDPSRRDPRSHGPGFLHRQVGKARPGADRHHQGCPVRRAGFPLRKNCQDPQLYPHPDAQPGSPPESSRADQQG